MNLNIMKVIKIAKNCCNIAVESFPTRRLASSVALRRADETRDRWRNRSEGGTGLALSICSGPAPELEPPRRSFSSAGEKIPVTKESKTSKDDDWGGPEAEKLIVHFKENVTDSIKTYDSLLLYFYTTWCRHCRQFKATYGQAAMKMKEEGVSGQLAAIDLTKRMEIADAFNVASVPQMQYFRKGEFIRIYNDKRTVDDILKFMKNPPTKAVIIQNLDI